MKAPRVANWLQWVFRLILGGVFVGYASDKIVDPEGFADSIGNYDMVPFWAVNAMALTLPWIEVLAGVVLITGPWRREAAGLCAVMLVVFMIAIGTAMARGLNINCGCSGSGAMVGWKKLGEDFALLAVSGILMLAKPAPRAKESAPDTAPAGAEPAPQ